MRYMMKQRIFSIGNKFVIKDETGRDAFFVQGKLFSIGNKLSFYDTSGREIIYIKQRIMSFTPTYEFYLNGRPFATLRKQVFTFFNCKFDIETINGAYRVEGSFLDHEYYFEKNGRTIARVSKEWFTFGDTYGIDIAGGEDNAFILACVVAIDMICHNDNK